MEIYCCLKVRKTSSLTDAFDLPHDDGTAVVAAADAAAAVVACSLNSASRVPRYSAKRSAKHTPSI